MGSNAQRRREAREKKVSDLRRQEQARERRSNVLLSTGLTVAVVLAIGGVWWAVEAGTEDPTAGALNDVQTFDIQQRKHVEDVVDYSESPPVGGNHAPIWLACESFDRPVVKEKAVHSLEHGAVWVTYRADLAQDEVDELKRRTDSPFVLLSPFEDQEAPVVASAWNNQLELDGSDDPRLDDFITEFRQGPQTPEPGASCDDPMA